MLLAVSRESHLVDQQDKEPGHLCCESEPLDADLAEIPESVKSEMTFTFVKNMHEVIQYALETAKDNTKSKEKNWNDKKITTKEVEQEVE